MSQYQEVKTLEVFQAPWNKEITLQELVFEGGFRMIRLRIREGRRFTDLELDPDSARALSGKLAAWAAE